MTEARTDIPSVLARTRPLAAGGPVVAAHFLDQTAVFVLGEEALLLLPCAGEARRVTIHAGAILSSAADATRVLTGGDDGQLVVIDAKGNSTPVATDANRRSVH